MTDGVARYGLVGFPIAHSRSPEIHHRWFSEQGLSATYGLYPLDPSVPVDLGRWLRDSGVLGANLTVPFKERILPFLQTQSEDVQWSGAANVVRVTEQGLEGYNTDGEGFCAGFEEEFGDLPTERMTVVLGAGGSARGIIGSLLKRGTQRIRVLNRTVARAESLIDAIGKFHPEVDLTVGPLHSGAFSANAKEVGLVINCTSGGAEKCVAALPTESLSADTIWCDLNYWSVEPPQFRDLVDRGLRFQTGFPMLVHQAALSFELFTGVKVNPRPILCQLR